MPSFLAKHLQGKTHDTPILTESSNPFCKQYSLQCVQINPEYLKCKWGGLGEQQRKEKSYGLVTKSVTDDVQLVDSILCIRTQ